MWNLNKKTCKKTGLIWWLLRDGIDERDRVRVFKGKQVIKKPERSNTHYNEYKQ